MDDEPKITAEAFAELATGGVPYVGQLGLVVERFERGRVTMRLPYQAILLRPGGTICGPAMMALADVTLYGVVLSAIGQVELAVTSDLNIHFLRKPKPGDLLAEGSLLKLGRSLAVGEVRLHTANDAALVAHVTATYAIPA